MTKALKARQELSQWQAASAQPLVQVARIILALKVPVLLFFNQSTRQILGENNTMRGKNILMEALSGLTFVGAITRVPLRCTRAYVIAASPTLCWILI